MSRQYTRLFKLTSIESLGVLLFIMLFAIPVKAQFIAKDDYTLNSHRSLQNTTLRGDIGNTIDLPKTGQTICYSMWGDAVDCALTGQDGDIQAGVAWPDPRFTDNEDGTMTDRLTGLMWPQDGVAPTVGACTGGLLKWQPALNYVKCLNNIEHLGYTDWRLPNVIEHTSLAHGDGGTHTWLNTQGFIDVARFAYWTSTTYLSRDDTAWTVTLDGMMNERGKRTQSADVWMVRAGQTDGNIDPAYPSNIWKTGQTECWDEYGRSRSCAGTGEDGESQIGVNWPESRFSDNLNDTVTDNMTGLTWAQNTDNPGPEICSQEFNYDWTEAFDYIVCLNVHSYLGRTNWRLPNFRELYSLIDYSQLGPALPPAHPFLIGGTYQTLSSNSTDSRAVILNVGAGKIEGRAKNTGYNVWPVSDGPSQLVPDIDISDSLDPFDDLKLLFEDVEVGDFADAIVTINNIGNGDLTIEPIGNIIPIAAPFSLHDDLCSDQTLSPAESCTFTVRFSPLEARLNTKLFNISSDDPNEPYFSISLRATGVEFVPHIRVRDESGRNISQVNFGDVPAGTSSEITVVVWNVGTADLTIGTIAQVDTLASPYNIVNDQCSGTTLTPATSCTFDVGMSPTEATPYILDNFDIPSNDPDFGSKIIGVYGRGVPADDDDEDGVPNNEDNCISIANPDQIDTDEDGKGDACDECPLDNPDDTDADGVCDSDDTCPGFDDNIDADGDGIADGCDICAGSDDTIDTDSDEVPDGCDACPLDNPDDSDGDGVCDSDDSCPNTPSGDEVYENGCTVGQTIIEIIDSSGDGAGNPLTLPSGIAVDANGNTFVAGKSSHNIFKITPAGIITEIIDVTGDGEDIAFSAPKGIAVDAEGNVYSTTSHGAVKITPEGVITQIIDGTAGGAGNLFGPHGIAVDTVGNVYVTGESSHNVFKITPDGVITQIIDNSGAGVGQHLSSPHYLAVDANQNVYVTGDRGNNAFKITPSGIITQIIDFTGDGAGNIFTGARGITVDANFNAYVVGWYTENVFKITPGGLITEIIDTLGDHASRLRAPNGVAVDAARNVYVTGRDSSNAYKITLTGSITQIIDVTGDGFGNTLSGPENIAVDTAGNVFVTGWSFPSNSSNAFKIILGPTDCNDNGIDDATDIIDGTSLDSNSNGIPDECELCPDGDDDGVCDSDDICPGFDDNFDDDEDGTPNGCDDCPNDPDKTTPGVCGCGIAEGTCGGCKSDDDCDDLVDCTNDFCDTKSGECSYTADDSICDDGLYCNGVETCDAELGCQDGTTVSCEDKDDCTVDTCDEVNDTCTHDDSDTDGDGTPDGCDPCPSHNPNDNEDGVCGPPSQGGGLSDSDGDGELNFFDDCPNTPAGAEVDDDGCSCDQLDSDEDGVNNCLDECDGTLVSSEIVGETGCDCSQLDCDDEEACTDDSCEDGVCINTSSCPDDGLFCNGDETCDDGACISSGNPCGDNETCNEDEDSCDPDDSQIGQTVPQFNLCGNLGEGCTLTPPALILTFFGLFALRFAGPRRRYR